MGVLFCSFLSVSLSVFLLNWTSRGLVAVPRGVFVFRVSCRVVWEVRARILFSRVMWLGCVCGCVFVGVLLCLCVVFFFLFLLEN